MVVNRLNNKPYLFFSNVSVYLHSGWGRGRTLGGGLIGLYKKAPPERGMFLRF